MTQFQIRRKFIMKFLKFRCFFVTKEQQYHKNVWLFSDLETIGLFFFSLLFKTVWLFIEVLIWKPW